MFYIINFALALGVNLAGDTPIRSHRFLPFKAFKRFTLHLRHFNILVGPNNAGKSTILAAFRVLAAALRKALSRKPEVVHGPRGNGLGYNVDLVGTSVAEENIFYNYDDSEPASVTFTLSNGNVLRLYFQERDVCNASLQRLMAQFR